VTKTRGIYEERRALRQRIAEWHTTNDASVSETAAHFNVSEFLVRKSLDEALLQHQPGPRQ